VLPAGHEPFVSQAQLQENRSPGREARIKVKSYTRTVWFLTWGQVLSSEGQRDLECLLFVIYFVFLARISYIHLTSADKS